MWPFRRKKDNIEIQTGPVPPQEQISDDSPDKLDSQPLVVTDTLDLHGFFPEQIPDMIADFIDQARELGLGRLRIVHGKGKSRLKWEVYQILKDHPAVASYRDAPPEAGGWGATVVLLRNKGEKI